MSKKIINNFLLSTVEERLHIALDKTKSEQLRTYLGQNAYEEYVVLARRTIPKLGETHLGVKTSKNLIFIPGVMGSFLKSDSLGGIWWINALAPEYIDKLRLTPNGMEDENPDFQINPATIDNSYVPFTSKILEQEDFGLETFPYDWRKPITLSTRILKDKILELYARNENKPVHLVAHSMGGLLVRATLMDYGQELSSKLGRIVFIGTPHYGSPKIAGYLKNHLWGFELMALLGLFLSRDTYRSLWGVLSMLPAPQGIYPGTRPKEENIWTSDDPNDSYIHPCINFDMYQADNWKLDLTPLAISQLQNVLDATSNFHQKMYDAHIRLDQSLRDRMAVIAGVGFDTLFRLAYDKQFFGIWERMTKLTKRTLGNPHLEGDNSVPLASAALEYVGEIRYVKGKHNALPNISVVYEDVLRWLRGDSMELPKSPSGALSSHLASEAGVSEAPNLDGTIDRDFSADDSSLWNFEQPSVDKLTELQAKLKAGQLPEFSRVRLL